MNDYDYGGPQEERGKITLGQAYEEAIERYTGEMWAQWNRNLSEDAIKDCVRKAFERNKNPPKDPGDGLCSPKAYWLMGVPDIYKEVCKHIGREPAKESWKMSSDKWWYEENA